MARPVSLSSSEIAQELRLLGFDVEPMGSKSQRAEREGLVIYLKKAKLKKEVLVVSPAFASQLGDLLAIPGVRRSAPANEFAHSSSYAAFPTRMHTGETPTHFGFDLEIETGEALAALVHRLLGQSVEDKSPTAEADADPDQGVGDDSGIDPRTETEVTRAARLGQRKFRADLMKRWNSRCALIGLDMPELLRASHIKPWCDASPKERLDPDNGLLLAVHIDVLFDSGLISFADDGRMIVSTKLSSATREALGIDRALSITGLSEGNRRYLAIHRDAYFQRTGR
jgi:putative restriction endonuclease